MILWTPEREAVLARLNLAGHAPGAIARKMGMSPAAVSGKLKRLGLRGDGVPSAPRSMAS